MTMKEEDIFTTPPDLTCPVTHGLFSDPVITVAGSIYERSAILEHLLKNDRDPLTGSTLTSTDLTPVYLLKSRALEYAECATRACIKRVLDPLCPNPVRWLHRAVDLCDESGFRVPDLSEDCIVFARTHRSSLHDSSVLLNFAHGLVAAGRHNQALSLYCNMLKLDPDRRAQTAVIKRCLPCWLAVMSESDPEAHAAAIVETIFQQRAMTSPVFFGILQDLGLPQKLLVQVCRLLMTADANQNRGQLTEGVINTSRTSHLLLGIYMDLYDAEQAETLKVYKESHSQRIAELEAKVASMSQAASPPVRGFRAYLRNLRHLRRLNLVAASLVLVSSVMPQVASRVLVNGPLVFLLTNCRP